jgi:hypothetical protein
MTLLSNNKANSIQDQNVTKPMPTKPFIKTTLAFVKESSKKHEAKFTTKNKKRTPQRFFKSTN